MQTKTINRNDWTGRTITFRFNAPTTDGQDGRLVVDGEIWTLRASTLDDGMRAVDMFQSGDPENAIRATAFAEDDRFDDGIWMVSEFGFTWESRNPIEALVIAGANLGVM